ncbi:MAG: hypothetical protein IPM45_00395 [Acidimicrobiales bacterium]|nr:hypothetical protein [Acidimicrobiales bacterium]
MHAIVIHESLTGNTRRAAEVMGAELERAGVDTTVCSITAIDHQALAEAELVVVGSWTDGLIFVGQRPGRAGRLKQLPAMVGKKAVVFVTYAVDVGKTLDKLTRIVEGRGAEVLGGMAIKRNDLEGGAREFVDRVLGAVAA